MKGKTQMVNWISSNSIKIQLIKTNFKSKCRLCGNRDETMIREWCNRMEKDEYRRMGQKFIHWELFKKLKFYHYWYMHKPLSVLENEGHTLPMDFKAQIDNLIPARILNFVIMTEKKKLPNTRFDVPVNHRVEIKENEKSDTYLHLSSEVKESLKYESDSDTICNRSARNCSPKNGKDLALLDFGGQIETVQSTGLSRLARTLITLRKNRVNFDSVEFSWTNTH